ncbi:Hypothetical protein PHPALM_5879 [Phytophthora palmivora]|uniref:Uncharacterized protein n=1 Tax=Phytophthora palmivora TaxID=4796 RepID=A0A2P4YGA8_9STRA|nr:Hypothetical protein PHPALM_5879 [Phytophthora palmivora]
MTPLVNSSLFTSGLGQCTSARSAGRRTHHPRQHLDRPDAVPRYFGQHQPGYGMLTTNLHRLYAAKHEAQPAVAPAPHHGGQWQGRVGCFQQQNQQVKYPDARQKKLTTIRQFERQVTLAQSVCVWFSVAGGHQSITEKYYTKQVEAWWVQLPTLG